MSDRKTTIPCAWAGCSSSAAELGVREVANPTLATSLTPNPEGAANEAPAVPDWCKKAASVQLRDGRKGTVVAVHAPQIDDATVYVTVSTTGGSGRMVDMQTPIEHISLDDGGGGGGGVPAVPDWCKKSASVQLRDGRKGTVVAVHAPELGDTTVYVTVSTTGGSGRPVDNQMPMEHLSSDDGGGGGGAPPETTPVVYSVNARIICKHTYLGGYIVHVGLNGEYLVMWDEVSSMVSSCLALGLLKHWVTSCFLHASGRL
jgi:hypothetical protein